jgi:hypothetical protein
LRRYGQYLNRFEDYVITRQFCDLSDVITLPYDSIHDSEQSQYYELSPYTSSADLGLRAPDEPDNNSTPARGYLQNWMAKRELSPTPNRRCSAGTVLHDAGRRGSPGAVSGRLELTPFDEARLAPRAHVSGPKVTG